MASATPADKTLSDKSLDRYESLLAEAARIRGVSLWKDAWRRLRKNWAAMISLWFLVALVVVAFLTPFLPLQSPQFQLADKEHKYQPPNLERINLNFQLEDAKSLEREAAELSARLRDLPKDAPEKERAALRLDLEAKRRDHPFNRLWNEPGALTSALIRARVALFGRWCIHPFADGMNWAETCWPAYFGGRGSRSSSARWRRWSPSSLASPTELRPAIWAAGWIRP